MLYKIAEMKGLSWLISFQKRSEEQLRPPLHLDATLPGREEDRPLQSKFNETLNIINCNFVNNERKNVISSI